MVTRRDFLRLSALALVASQIPVQAAKVSYPPIEFILSPPFATPADPLAQRIFYGWRATVDGKQYGDYVALGDNSPETLAVAKEVLTLHAHETIDMIRNA